jgi:transposase
MARARSDCPGCLRRDRRIAALHKENQGLRQQLEALQRQQHRQAHPFRRDDAASENDAADAPATTSAAVDQSIAAPSADSATKKRKAGRRKGHRPDVRPTPTHIDRVIDVPLDECPDCHAPLYDPDVVVQYQTDLPPIVPIVTQFNIQTGRCSCCRQHWQGRHPEQTSDAIGIAGNTLGPVTLSMAAEMKHRLGVSYRKICDFLKTYCGLKACSGAFIRAEQRLAELAKPTYDLLLEALRQSHVVHADETGWRIGRLSAWLWVFSSKDTTIYAIRHSRAHDVPEDILGPDFDGYLIVDGLKTYNVLNVAKGRCNGHLLRRCKGLRTVVPAKERQHLESVITLLKEAIALAQRREQLADKEYQGAVERIEERLDDWLEANNRKRTVSPELDRLDRHIREHRGEWLVFLHDPEVPPTNNHAERMLRPAVITRKVGGCNKNLMGALVHSILSSIIVSCHRQGRRFLDLARQLWQSSQPQAVPLDRLPQAS